MSLRPPAKTLAGLSTGAAGETQPTMSFAPGTRAPGGGGLVSGTGYELRGRIGRGGMGEVWQALQVSLGRVVAVKSPIDDGKSSAARNAAFRQEALVAAQLEHPNIVPVHDQGTDASGKPLLAMKLVQGRAWDMILREDLGKLSPEDLLGKHLPILVDVTQAVAFAHSRGIIHRDLKPAQVMVGAYGEVMLMDWGLAMFIGDPKVLEGVVRDEFPTRDSCSNPSGTPAMMAPEQTREDASQLGERTDVYLLGGTLYYLLTGTYPHQAATARESFVRASDGTIEPPTSRTKNALPEDLVAICLAALHPNPAQRTPSAEVFLEQLRDYLSGASRRREAMQIADRLESPEKPRRDHAGMAAAEGELARAFSLWPGNPRLLALQDKLLAEHARLAIAQEDLNLAEVQAGRITDQKTSRALLEEVARLVERRKRIASQRRVAGFSVAALLGVIAIGSSVFGMRLKTERDEAQRQRERAVEAEGIAEERRATVERKGEALREARMDADGLVSYMLGDLRGRLAELERLDLLDGVAAEAAEYYRQTPFEELDVAERIQTIRGMIKLIEVQMAQANLAAADEGAAMAEEFARRAAAAAPDDIATGLELMTVLAMRARIAFERADLEAALKFSADALELGEALLRLDPDNLEVLLNQSIILSDQMGVLKGLGRIQDALASAEEGVRIMERIVPDHPGDPRIGFEMAARLSTLGSIQWDNELHEESVKSLEASRDIVKSIVELNPGNRKWESDYATALQSCGHLIARTGDLASAEEQIGQALEILERLVAEDPSDMTMLVDATKNLHYVAQLQQQQGQLADAEATYRRGVERADQLMARDPANAQNAFVGVVLRFGLARLINGQGRRLEAAKLYEWNCATLEQLLAREPASAYWRQQLGSNLYDLSEIRVCLGDLASARQSFRRCYEIYGELHEMNPQLSINRDMQQASYISIAQTARAAGDHDQAMQDELMRLPLLEALAADEPDEDIWKREYTGSMLAIADDLVAVGRTDDARDRIMVAMTLRPAEGGEHWKWEALAARAKIVEGRADRTDGNNAKGDALLREGRDMMLAVINAESLEKTSMSAVSDLVLACRELGEDVDPAWIEYLTGQCFALEQP